MVFNKGMTTVDLLEFGEKAGSDVARALEGAEEGLDGFLPGFDVLPAGGGEDLACGSEAFVGVYLCDDVEGFSHDEVVFWYGKDGSNFLSDQLGRSRNIIILKEMNIMLDILDSKRQSNPHAEGTVIVHVNDGELVEDDASSLDEG